MRRLSSLSILAVSLTMGLSHLAISQQPSGTQASATGGQSADVSSELPAPQSNASQSNATQSSNNQPSSSQSSASQSNSASSDTNASGQATSGQNAAGQGAQGSFGSTSAQADASSNLSVPPDNPSRDDFNADLNAGADANAGVGSSSMNRNNSQNRTAGSGNNDFNNNANIDSDANASWRYREYQGRQWYWQGDRQTGHWMYLNNGIWTPYREPGSMIGQTRSSGYRGTSSQYDGPYYFDNTGRRYLMDGNTYRLDQTWNDQFWNDSYQSSYQNYWNDYRYRNDANWNTRGTVEADGSFYNPSLDQRQFEQGRFDSGVGANPYNNNSVGGRVGQALGGQGGANIGAGVDSAIRGGTGAGQNIGGAVGQALGGQAGARVGSAVGGAIDQGR